MVIFKKCPKAIKVSFVKCFLKSNNTPPFTLKLHTTIKNEKKNSMLNFRVQLFLQLTPASFFFIFTPQTILSTFNYLKGVQVSIKRDRDEQNLNRVI